MKCSFFTVLLLMFIKLGDASHFRGAIITWKPSGRATNEILISFRVSWRRTWSSAVACVDNDITSGRLLTGLGSLIYLNPSGGSSVVTSGAFVCTDFNPVEDWTTGERTDFAYTIPSPTFHIGFSGFAWISLQVAGNGDWKVFTAGNITVRADTGRINSSPVTSTAPIVRLQQNCQHTINLRITDPDNDVVRCRFATGSAECGAICGGLPGSHLDPDTCVLSYNATGTLGLYGVAIQVEDFASASSTTPLSSVALQFLINVYSSPVGGNCSAQPRFAQITRPDGSCVGVPVNVTYREKIYATTRTSVAITSFTTSSPVGLIKSNITMVPSNQPISFLDVLPAGAHWYYMEVTWIPTSFQTGGHIFCFTAVTAALSTTDQRCVTFLVGSNPPVRVANSLSPQPNSVVSTSREIWEMQFQEPFRQPNRQTLFRIYTSANNTLVYSVDLSLVSSQNYVVSSANKLTIRTPGIQLLNSVSYFITFDYGVVRGLTLCGVEAEPIFDVQGWTFVASAAATVSPTTTAPTTTAPSGVCNINKACTCASVTKYATGTEPDLTLNHFNEIQPGDLSMARQYLNIWQQSRFDAVCKGAKCNTTMLMSAVSNITTYVDMMETMVTSYNMSRITMRAVIECNNNIEIEGNLWKVYDHLCDRSVAIYEIKMDLLQKKMFLEKEMERCSNRGWFKGIVETFSAKW